MTAVAYTEYKCTCHRADYQCGSVTSRVPALSSMMICHPQTILSTSRSKVAASLVQVLGSVEEQGGQEQTPPLKGHLLDAVHPVAQDNNRAKSVVKESFLFQETMCLTKIQVFASEK